MSTEAHAPALPRASTHLPADEQMAPDRGAKVDDSQSGLQVPDNDHESGTPKPLERGPLWLEDPDNDVDTGISSPSSFRMPVVKWPPRAQSAPPTDSEKKSVAQFAVRQQWKRIPEYMQRVNLVREAEAREAQAAARGSSAKAFPTALDLAALSYPIPAALRARSEEVATPPQKRKRAHDDDDGVDNEEHDAKRRRVGSDASPPSSAVDRPVAGNPARGGRTGATATTNHKLTTNDASRASRTTVKLKPTLSKCPPPPRGKTVAGNAKVEKALSTVPTLGQCGRVRLKRQATPPDTAPPPRQRRQIPHPKAAPAKKAAPAEAPSPQLSSSSAGEPAPSGDKAPATPRQARKIPFPKAASGVTAGGPDAPCPGPSSSSSAGEPNPTPTPKGKPLGRTLLRRQPTSFFFAAPVDEGVDSSVQGARADDGSMGGQTDAARV